MLRHYRALGLPENASKKEIIMRFSELLCKAQRKRINFRRLAFYEAYNVLIDKFQRAKYPELYVDYPPVTKNKSFGPPSVLRDSNFFSAALDASIEEKKNSKKPKRTAQGVPTVINEKFLESTTSYSTFAEAEANRVAQEAIKAFQASRETCARVEEGTPAWTGQNGGRKPISGPNAKSSINQSTTSRPSGEPSGVKRAPPSSTKSPQKTSKAFKPDQRDKNDDTTLRCFDPNSTEYGELLDEIKKFVATGAAVDGQATTKELVEAFTLKFSLNYAANFKTVLSKVCDFSTNPNKEGVWRLKEEFRV